MSIICIDWSVARGPKETGLGASHSSRVHVWDWLRCIHCHLRLQSHPATLRAAALGRDRGLRLHFDCRTKLGRPHRLRRYERRPARPDHSKPTSEMIAGLLDAREGSELKVDERPESDLEEH